MEDINEFIGKSIKFSCQPYYFGEGNILCLNKTNMWSCLMPAGEWEAEVLVTEGVEVNRLLGHVSNKSITGQVFIIPRVRLNDLQKREVLYVYPV